MRPLRRRIAAREVVAGIGLGVAARHGLAHRVGERAPGRNRGEHEPEGSAHAAFDAEHAVATLHELQEGVDDRQPGPHRRLVADATAALLRHVEQPTVAVAGAGEGLLVREHEVEAVAEGGVQEVARLLGGHVHHHRPRDRVIGDEGEGRRRRGALAAERREHRAPVLAPGQTQQSCARDAFGLEHVARAVEQAHEAHRRRAVVRGELVGEGPAHPAEAEQDHVGARGLGRAPAADLRKLEGRVDAPRGLGGVGGRRPRTRC